MCNCNQTPVPNLLKAVEAAQYLRQKPSTLAHWRHLRQGPKHFKLGKHVMYRRAELDRWIEEQEGLAG